MAKSSAATGQQPVPGMLPGVPRRRPVGRAPGAPPLMPSQVVNHAPITRTKKSTEYEIMQRRKDVYRLRLRGLSCSDIAKRLNISLFTAQKDLATIQSDHAAKADQFTQNQFVGETMTVLDEVMEHAWEEFHQADAGSKQRIQALDLIRTTQNDKLTALTDVGLVAKAVQQVEHKHTLQLPWDDQLKDTVIQKMLESRLTPELAAPTMDENHVPGKNLDIQEAVIVEAHSAVVEQTPMVVTPEEVVPDARMDALIKKLVGSGMPLETAQKIAVEGRSLAEAHGSQVAKQLVDKYNGGDKPGS